MTITLNIWTILFLFTSFHGLLLFFLLIGTREKRNYRPNWWIAGAVLVFTIIILWNTAYWNGLHRKLEYIHLNKLYWPFTFLVGPFMYLYLQSQLAPERKKAVYHLLLPALVLVALIPFYLKPATAKAHYYDAQLHLNARNLFLHWLLIVVSILQLFAYATANFILIRRYRHSLVPGSGINNKTLDWFNALALAFTIFTILYFSYYLLVAWLGFPVTWDYLISLTMAVMIYYTGFKAYSQPELFREREKLEFENRRQNNQLIPQSEVGRYKKRIRMVMEREKPFLDDQLKLNDLASMVDLSPHQLSYCLNRYFNTSFSDFINSYRIEEAKRLLTDPHKEQLKILAIGYNAGFNSKTSFYTTFKKHTGMTPSTYRKTVSMDK